MAGNWGNWGNWGNSGNGVGAGLAATSAGLNGEAGGGWFIEDRVDLPFVTEPVEALGEPPFLEYDDFKDTLGKQVRRHLTTYADRQWTAHWYSWRVLEEFARRDWQQATDEEMRKAWKAARINDPCVVGKEIHALARAARDERASAMGEILSQHVEFITDFMALLTIAPGSHPRTYRILHIASLIGAFVSLHYKAKDDWHVTYVPAGEGSDAVKVKTDPDIAPGPRPRPSQLCPALAPPVPVPGHPAFPSGHATQSMLMAACITHVLTPPPADGGADDVLALAQRGPVSGGNGSYAATATAAPTTTAISAIHPDDVAVITMNLQALARRIARNREIAGLHYRTDSLAGQELARLVFGELKQCPRFVRAVDDARSEWT